MMGIPKDEVVRCAASVGGTVACAEPDDAVAGLESFQYYVVPVSGPILAA
jgi:hypothetical protein